MEHTPTPWTEQHKYLNTNLAILTKVDYDRAKICVNACAEFPDPKIDIGLLKLHLEQQNRKLASCEAALAERDKEIAKLKELAVEVNILEKDGHIQAVGIKQMNVEEYTLQSEQIQALQDRVKAYKAIGLDMEEKAQYFADMDRDETDKLLHETYKILAQRFEKIRTK